MNRSTIAQLATGAALVAANLVISVSSPAPSASAAEPARTESITGTQQACCFEPGNICELFMLENCLLVGGMPQGPGTDCAAVSCLPGACCLPLAGDSFCIGEGLTETVCEAIGGTFGGHGSKCIEVGCTANLCPSDVTGDGEVGIDDFLQVLADWGTCQ